MFLVVSADGIIPLTDTDTVPSTLALFSMGDANADDDILHLEDAVLQATLARATRPRPGDTGAGKCRMSGRVRHNSGKPQRKVVLGRKWPNLTYVNTANSSWRQIRTNISLG